MPLFDLPQPELDGYLPEIAEPVDFDAFWDETLAEAAQRPLDVVLEPIDNRLATIDTYDLTFTGFGGTRVKGWLHVPAGSRGPLPAVVQYHGYSGGREIPLNNVYAQAGYAHFELDTRGQGWGGGSTFETTPDDDPRAGLTSAPGKLTQGLLDPRDHYYRRLITDAVRLLQVAAASSFCEGMGLVVTGISQGGGLALAVAGLANRVGIRLAGVSPDVPFLCHFERAVEIADEPPYTEIAVYLQAYPHNIGRAFWTLSHFDGANFAKRISAPALFSVARNDHVCPPSTVYAAYNALTGPKEIAVYPFNGHEGGMRHQTWRRLGWLRHILAVEAS